MSADVVDPVFQYRIRLREEGEVLRGDFLVEPGGGGAIDHVHPATEERFEIVEGQITFWIDRRKREAGAGERLSVPAGTRHAFVNTGEDAARVVVEMEPSLELAGLFEEVAALARAGKWRRLRRIGVPTGPRALLDMADLLWRYRNVFVMSFPPPSLQRPVLPLLSRLARRRGRAGR